MLGHIQRIFTSLQELTWERIFMLTVILMLLLSAFLGYKYIDTVLDFQKKQETLSEDLFIEQFSKKHLYSDSNIHDILVELRIKTNANWALFLGIHNGSSVGPYHLKRISAVDESVVRGNSSLYPRLQNIPLTLFSPHYPMDLESDSIISRDLSLDSGQAVVSEIARQGIVYEISTGVYIQGYESPIGFLGVFYQEGSYIPSGDELTVLEAEVLLARRRIEIQLRALQEN